MPLWDKDAKEDRVIFNQFEFQGKKKMEVSVSAPFILTSCVFIALLFNISHLKISFLFGKIFVLGHT